MANEDVHSKQSPCGYSRNIRPTFCMHRVSGPFDAHAWPVTPFFSTREKTARAQGLAPSQPSWRSPRVQERWNRICGWRQAPPKASMAARNSGQPGACSSRVLPALMASHACRTLVAPAAGPMG